MKNQNIRNPAFAGAFYPSTERAVKESIESCFKGPHGPGIFPNVQETTTGTVGGVITPHAGFVYSGPIAAFSYLEITKHVKANTFIIIGPNHQGWGVPLAIDSSDSWMTPLGNVSIDNDIRDKIHEIDDFKLDKSAHANEHSIEVQLPFLQTIRPDAKFVPICVQRHSTSDCIALGESIATAIEGESVALIASTDLTHFLQYDEAVKQDNRIITKINDFDIVGLGKMVYEEKLTMCGITPVLIVLAALKKLGFTKTQHLDYKNSGDTSGNKRGQIVGYLATSIKTE